MTTTEKTRNEDMIPEIEFPYPPCPVCGEDDLEYDEGWSCGRCCVSWDKNGQYASFYDPTAKTCRDDRQVQRWSLSERMICQLHAGHDGPHAGYNPETQHGPADWWRWDDDGKYVV